MREVWIVSNVPPPLHGVSAFNSALRERLDADGVPSRLFRIGTRGALTEVERFRAGKLAGDAATLARLAAAAAGRGARRPVIYFTPSQRGTAVARDAAVGRIARLFGLPLVAHLHGCSWLDVWEQGGWQGRLMFDALRGCERVICLGRSYAVRMQAATGFPCASVDNGVSASPDAAIRRAPAAGERIELLYLSNLVPRKGVWTAARALRTLRARGLDARLRCAGSWSDERDRDAFLRELAAELAAGTIELVGFAGDALKRRLFGESHFFLLPTELLEGQPLSLIEAMACGLVPITTQQGGIPDLFGFEGWDALASPRHRDPGAVADTVAALVADPERYRAASAACLERARTGLTVERCTGDVLRILQGGA